MKLSQKEAARIMYAHSRAVFAGILRGELQQAGEPKEVLDTAQEAHEAWEKEFSDLIASLTQDNGE